MKSFIERENGIFDILDSFNKTGLKYVLIGCYAVSAYMRRFSVDADVCIDKRDLFSFIKILKAKHFELVKRKDLDDIYKGAFECYTKKVKLPVTVDLMIGSVASRQTNASVSFEKLHKNSSIKSIVGIEKTVSARIPAKEILIALKINSARLTDARDIVALCQNVDLSMVMEFIDKNKETRNNLDKLLSYFISDNFKDAFKGVFSIEKLPKGNIENAIKLVKSLKEEI